MLLERLKLERYQLQALSWHDLFKHLSGNPMSIVMLAACHSNPFFKTNSLAELYDKVRNGKNLCENDNESNSSENPNIGKNNISLNFTMDASI